MEAELLPEELDGFDELDEPDEPDEPEDELCPDETALDVTADELGVVELACEDTSGATSLALYHPIPTFVFLSVN